MLHEGHPEDHPEGFHEEQEEVHHQDGNETPELDDQAKMEILQKMQEEQAAISRRIIRRKKSK